MTIFDAPAPFDQWDPLVQRGRSSAPPRRGPRVRCEVELWSVEQLQSAIDVVAKYKADKKACYAEVQTAKK